ncbi:beta-N-acetylhexosaminidase [Shimia abyssi]|uniref:beta-N-acetylhexosaminidase n=1 Tax=Shimia abyssi TaxID=1662395 RepID=A0A2P8FDH6_9RHOB|nr:family 20 glycosylhydrolase [Shimia abyssi]PSL19775.1 hexosaminidase [Shimia abyssi]
MILFPKLGSIDMQYSCHISGDTLVCLIQTRRALSAPVFCFSGIAPYDVISGGTLLTSVGGYTEIALPDLHPDTPHTVTLCFEGGFTPANRAWMPLGPRLKTDGETLFLPATPVGRSAPPQPDPRPVNGLPILPQPCGWTPANGHLSIDGLSFDDAALTAVADLATRQGMTFRGTHPINLIAGDLPNDAYEIDVTQTAITITSASYGGRFYAGVTLLLLLQHGPLPCGRITDTPRFDWRGQQLDTARHFYEPATILRLLDLMALLKLNRFHWHFADDEAFRIEIDSIPELWQQTALRGDGHLLPGIFSDMAEAGGTYSKSDVQRIIAHAKHLNIEVLPEIEAPAHALAIAKIFPDTRDPDDTGQERSVQGYARNVLNPAMPKTWEILEKLALEIGSLFPFGHLHLGCDELPEDTWMGSPRARALMAEHGLETTDDLLGWTIAKLARTVANAGLRPAAWEEAQKGNNGGIGNNAILFSWTGQGPGLDAARAGYDVVMCPAQNVYLDMAHTSDPDDWGAGWAAFVSLEDTVSWDPVPDPALANRIIGVQGTFWSEFTTQDDQIWPMLMPRMLGVASMAWQSIPPTPAELTDLATHFSYDPTSGLKLR